MKRCFKCGKEKPRSEFYKHPAMADGLLGKCKTCTKNDVKVRYIAKHDEIRAWDNERNKTPERRAYRSKARQRHRVKYPEREAARRSVAWHVSTGALKKKPCEKCGSLEVEAHHEDYRRKLDVRWLCRTHHREVEGRLIKKSNAARTAAHGERR